MTHASMDAPARATAGIGDGLLRLSVGIESGRDLVDDLRSALEHAAPRVTPVRAVRGADADTTNVVLLGAGSIGRELLTQFSAVQHASPARFTVCGVADRTGFLGDASGLSPLTLRQLHEQKRTGGGIGGIAGAERGGAGDLITALASRGLQRAVLVDVTATDTHDLLRLGLRHGWAAVLANKIPLAADQSRVDALWRAAEEYGCQLRYEATVGAGLPIIDTIGKLLESGDDVVAIEGCPSGTLGFLFAELGAGRPFSEALAEAVDLGLTEPDPRVDLAGLDVARKALILGRQIGYRGNLDDVAVEPLFPRDLAKVSVSEFLQRTRTLDGAWADRVAEARDAGCVLRYRVRVTPAALTVGLVRVPLGRPLAALSGTDNQFAITTARYDRQPLVITGPGAGPGVTAAGVYNDLRAIAATRQQAPIGARRGTPRIEGHGAPMAARLAATPELSA
jgi:aspartokinase/homoserine dehydrogenase 1